MSPRARIPCRLMHAFAAAAALLQGAAGTAQQITHHDTPGSLQGQQPLACGSSAVLKNTDTPPDIYAGMIACAQDARYAEGVYFFALAGAYSYFDAERVADETARQGRTVLLQRSLGALDVPVKNAFLKEVSSTLDNPAKLFGVCEELRRIGFPQYEPTYMIRHGMGAAPGSNATSNGLIANFDAAAGWNKALADYLHCPRP